MVLEVGQIYLVGDEEPVEFTDKCREAARKWAAVADELWRGAKDKKRKRKAE